MDGCFAGYWQILIKGGVPNMVSVENRKFAKKLIKSRFIVCAYLAAILMLALMDFRFNSISFKYGVVHVLLIGCIVIIGNFWITGTLGLKCPHCGKIYGGENRWEANLFRSKCNHCGFKSKLL
jgi:hypothetical protein